MNLPRFLPRFLFKSQEPSSVFFPGSFQESRTFLGLFHGLFLKVKYLPNGSIFRVYFFFSPLFFFFLVHFLDFSKNPTSVPRTLFRSISRSILGVRTLLRFIARFISGVRTLPRYTPRSISESPNIDQTIPSSVCTADTYNP